MTYAPEYLNYRLAQQLIAQGYSDAMLLAVDMLQDTNITRDKLDRYKHNMMESDKLTKAEKAELKEQWIPTADGLVMFNEQPDDDPSDLNDNLK